jgi:hypothetical protein
MEAFVLKLHEIPPTLYRAQCAAYYIPPCAAMEKGIHALNSKPEALLSRKQLIEAVDNHLRLAEPPKGPIQSQWPTPFLSVFSQRENAEEALNGCNKYSGCGNWRIIEVSSAVVSARGVKVLRLRDVKGSTAPFEESQYLVWRFIPQEAFVTDIQYRIREGKYHEGVLYDVN